MSCSPSRVSVAVSTGSRLHFGLTRTRPDGSGRYGGAGVMIEHPATEIRIEPAQGLVIQGSERIGDFARNWATLNNIRELNCRVELLSAPPAHAGLGSGTQLAHSVATGLNRFLGFPEADPVQVALHLDRGKRSMIGTHGFARGGLVVDGVATAGCRLANPAKQLAIPGQWQIVLVMHHDARKKFGVQEQSAFDSICAGPCPRSRRLEDLVEDHMVPAVQNQDFGRFVDSVFEFGKISGEYYINVQGGIYNGPVIASVVDALLGLDARGVGQSSWGPVVFSWCENRQAARTLVSKIESVLGNSAKVWTTSVRNQPASVTEVRI